MKEIQITFHKRIQQSWIYFSAFSRVLWSVFLQHEANTPNYTFTEEKWTKNYLTEVSPLSSHNYKLCWPTEALPTIASTPSYEAMLSQSKKIGNLFWSSFANLAIYTRRSCSEL